MQFHFHRRCEELSDKKNSEVASPMSQRSASGKVQAEKKPPQEIFRYQPPQDSEEAAAEADYHR